MRAASVVLLVAFGGGCVHTDLARNAPGIVDLRTPPASEVVTEATRLEAIRDPGEHLVVLSYGGFGGLGGGSWAPRAGTHVFYAAGPEVSVFYGSNASSHYADDFFVLPSEALGLSLGATALGSEDRGAGLVYGEVAARFYTVCGAGAGWAWDVTDRAHGPQATLHCGPLYLRGNVELGFGAQLGAGIILKGWHTWVFSR